MDLEPVLCFRRTLGTRSTVCGKGRIFFFIIELTATVNKKRNLLILGNLVFNSLLGIFLLPLVYWEMGYSRTKLFYWGGLPCRHCTRSLFYPLMCKSRAHLWRCVGFFFPVITMLEWIPLMIMSKKNVLFSVIKECLSARLPLGEASDARVDEVWKWE